MHLLDSNILIYAALPEHDFLNPLVLSPEARLSAISIPEVLGYQDLTPEDEALFESWFADLAVCAVTDSILRRAAALRREKRMKLGDSIIAATALTLNAKLITRNGDDFKHIAGLEVSDPFRLEAAKA